MPKSATPTLDSSEQGLTLDEMCAMIRSRASVLWPAYTPSALEVVTAKNPSDNKWKAAVVGRIPEYKSRDGGSVAAQSVVLLDVTAYYTLTIDGKPAGEEMFKKLRHGARPVVVKLLLHALEEKLWGFLQDRAASSAQHQRIELNEELPAYKA